MRTESEMLDLILRTAKVIQADSVALSGSRTNPNAPKDEFFKTMMWFTLWMIWLLW